MQIQKIDIQDSKNNIVKKANELVKAKGELSETAQKMLAMLLSMIRIDDTEFQRYALNIREYKKEIEIKSKKSKLDYIENAKELMSNPFIIDNQMFNWCSKVDWGSVKGYIVFDIHKDLKPYLLQLKEGNFLQYNITNIMKLKGKYSPRLYEYFKMQWKQHKHYHPNDKNYTFEIKIDWLRNFLKISKGYRYDNIKTQIIEKAKKDFKQYTDIQFTYKAQALFGKKIDRLIITVKDNNKGSNDYLRDLKSFISFYRKNKVNEDLYEDEKLCLSISERGRLYDKYTAQEYNKDDAMIVWRKLYEKAKKDELSDKISQKNR